MYRREKMVARIWLKNKNKKIGRKKRTKKKKSKWNGEEKTCIWVCFCTVHSFQKYLNILKVLCILWYVRNRVIMNTNALYVHEHLSALSKTLSNSKWKTGALFISLFFSRIIFPFPFLLFFFFYCKLYDILLFMNCHFQFHKSTDVTSDDLHYAFLYKSVF